MEKLNSNYWILLAGIGLIVLEIILGAATGFDLLIIGIIFIISSLAGMLFNSFIFTLSIIIVLIFLYIFFGRKFVQQKLSIETKMTNVDAIINKKGIVTKEIGKHKKGQVKIDGEIWLAEADEEITKGSEVIIKSVSGVTLKVARS